MPANVKLAVWSLYDIQTNACRYLFNEISKPQAVKCFMT